MKAEEVMSKVPEERRKKSSRGLIHWIGLMNFSQDSSCRTTYIRSVGSTDELRPRFHQCRTTYGVDWTDELHLTFPVRDHIWSGNPLMNFIEGFQCMITFGVEWI
jgi:hypothetical protein